MEEQTTQNLLEAGVIKLEEVAKTIILQLKDYSLEALFFVLVQSLHLRELRGNPSRPIIYSPFSQN